jgi:hypothetical protein
MRDATKKQLMYVAEYEADSGNGNATYFRIWGSHKTK